MSSILFDVSAQDQSVYYLGQIFGLVGDLLPAKSASWLMGTLFKFINSLALTIGAFLVVYVTVIGLIATAHEGEFMGKKWNGLWVPLRTVFGIAALFPTASGYCAIQLIFMWVIVQGVGAADTLWTNAIKYVAKTGSPGAPVDISSINTTSVEDSLTKLFPALVCQAQAHLPSADVDIPNKKSISFYCKPDSKDTFCNTSQADMLNILGPAQSDLISKYNMGPQSLCGTLTFCDASLNTKDMNSSCVKFQENNKVKLPWTGVAAPDQIDCAVCKAQQAALQTIVTTFGGLAEQFANTDNAYLLFYFTSGTTTPPWVLKYCAAQSIPIEASACCVNAPVHTVLMPSPPIVCSSDTFNNVSAVESTTTMQQGLNKASANTVNNLYMAYALQATVNNANIVQDGVSTYLSGIVAAISAWVSGQDVGLNDWQQQAIDQGWILAGGYYFKIASAGQAKMDVAQPTLAVSVPESSALPWRNNYDAASAWATKNAGAGQAPSTFGGGDQKYAGVSTALGNTKGTLLRSMISNMSGNHSSYNVLVTGSLLKLSNFGYSLMITAQLLFVVITASAMLIAGLTNINPIVLGSGVTTSPAGEAVKAGIGLMGPFLTILVSSLFSLGALLAIYVPLIPVVVFTVGAIGWMIATIEAMVAAPLVALGILSPGGQHEILGRAEPALMLLFNLFLRPTLMVLGMMAAMLVSDAVVNLINVAFLNAVSTIITAPGLFEEVMFIAAYTSLLVTALNKTFSLIYVIPERVLTWIGGPAVQYGEAEALGAMKQGIEGAASATSGAASQSAGSAYGGVAGVKTSATNTETSDKGKAKVAKRAAKAKAAGLPNPDDE